MFQTNNSPSGSLPILDKPAASEQLRMLQNAFFGKVGNSTEANSKARVCKCEKTSASNSCGTSNIVGIMPVPREAWSMSAAHLTITPQVKTQMKKKKTHLILIESWRV
jgi:hypothetical protein